MRFGKLMLVTTIAASSVPMAATSFAHGEKTEKGEKYEKTVKLEEIPAPAREAILREAKGAPVQRVEEEKEKGKTVYEGVIKQGNEEVGILVDAKGKFMGKHSETKEHEKGKY